MTTVEYAIIFFISYWDILTIAKKNEVKPPIKVMNTKSEPAYSKNIAHLVNKKIPAVTIVAACDKELTGVGPSIASGNRVCEPICADLPIPPIVKIY